MIARAERALMIDANDSQLRIERAENAEPIDRMLPAEPMDRIEPVDPMLRMLPVEPMERIEPEQLRDLMDMEPALAGSIFLELFWSEGRINRLSLATTQKARLVDRLPSRWKPAVCTCANQVPL